MSFSFPEPEPSVKGWDEDYTCPPMAKAFLSHDPLEPELHLALPALDVNKLPDTMQYIEKALENHFKLNLAQFKDVMAYTNRPLDETDGWFAPPRKYLESVLQAEPASAHVPLRYLEEKGVSARQEFESAYEITERNDVRCSDTDLLRQSDRQALYIRLRIPPQRPVFLEANGVVGHRVLNDQLRTLLTEPEIQVKLWGITGLQPIGTRSIGNGKVTKLIRRRYKCAFPPIDLANPKNGPLAIAAPPVENFYCENVDQPGIGSDEENHAYVGDMVKHVRAYDKGIGLWNSLYGQGVKSNHFPAHPTGLDVTEHDIAQDRQAWFEEHFFKKTVSEFDREITEIDTRLDNLAKPRAQGYDPLFFVSRKELTEKRDGLRYLCKQRVVLDHPEKHQPHVEDLLNKAQHYRQRLITANEELRENNLFNGGKDARQYKAAVANVEFLQEMSQGYRTILWDFLQCKNLCKDIQILRPDLKVSRDPQSFTDKINNALTHVQRRLPHSLRHKRGGAVDHSAWNALPNASHSAGAPPLSSSKALASASENTATPSQANRSWHRRSRSGSSIGNTVNSFIASNEEAGTGASALVRPGRLGQQHTLQPGTARQPQSRVPDPNIPPDSGRIVELVDDDNSSLENPDHSAVQATRQNAFHPPGRNVLRKKPPENSNRSTVPAAGLSFSARTRAQNTPQTAQVASVPSVVMQSSGSVAPNQSRPSSAAANNLAASILPTKRTPNKLRKEHPDLKRERLKREKREAMLNKPGAYAGFEIPTLQPRTHDDGKEIPSKYASLFSQFRPSHIRKANNDAKTWLKGRDEHRFKLVDKDYGNFSASSLQARLEVEAEKRKKQQLLVRPVFLGWLTSTAERFERVSTQSLNSIRSWFVGKAEPVKDKGKRKAD